MKVKAECAACIINRAAAEVEKATRNPALRFRAMLELLRLMSREFKPTSVPADLGTKRDRLIKRITGNFDPYERSKKISNEKALKLLPYAKTLVKRGYNQQDRFKRACLYAIVGNSIEFDIHNREFSFNTLKKDLRNAKKELVVDDVYQIYAVLKKVNSVLYLTDNAGEIVFDTLLVQEIKNMGLKITVCVKGGPVINDATLEDAKVSSISEIADKTITTGTDAVGFTLKGISTEFANTYDSADVVLAKGMGYAETLTEYKLKKPHALLFRVKCNPIAEFFSVPKEKNVAKFLL